MATPRVLVVSGSAGHGHVMAGRAVADAIATHHPGVDVSHVDAVEEMAPWYRRTYRWGYLTMVDRHPAVWRAVYEATDRKTSALGRALTVAGGRRFVRLCQRWAPHVIVCTHFLAPELLARAIRQGKLQTRLEAVVTDHDAHRVWHYPEVSRYYVASEHVKARLALRYGVPGERIRVTGIPVRAAFTRRHDLTKVRRAYGLDASRPVVLFFSGGFSSGPIRDSIVGLWLERRDVQVVCVCGRNERLRRHVASVPRPAGSLLLVLGFVDRPDELMAVADVVIGKSGGVSTAEATALGKPVLVLASIPGQEERNADALLEAGAGWKAPTPEEVRWRVSRFLEDPDLRRRAEDAARAFGKPDAARAVADGAVEGLDVAALPEPRFHGAS
jgi:processive 1,2-diacylglycerol beta-glucosyltransferase